MNYRNLFAVAALVGMASGMAGCSNQNGAGGTVDGTSMDAYELNTNQDNLAPALDSVAAAPAPADSGAAAPAQ